jgi:hypothetical protein
MSIHPISPIDLAQWASQLIAHSGEYGFVSRMAGEICVSRQTLYNWKDKGQDALVQAFTPPCRMAVITPTLERQILTLYADGHASHRGIQVCLRSLSGQNVSLDTIGKVIHKAEGRALRWFDTATPSTSRALAPDEMYGNNRRGAYLSVVDVHANVVWSVHGPLPVDTDTWTLIFWELQDRGLHWHAMVHDGGKAMDTACTIVDPGVQHGRDVWHVLHVWSQVQGRLDRRVKDLEARTPTVERQAARVAAGKRPLGKKPVTDLDTHKESIAGARQIAGAVRYLGHELHGLLGVVVVHAGILLDSKTRRDEIEALLSLLDELAQTAPSPMNDQIHKLHTHVTNALSGLLAFTHRLDHVHQGIGKVLDAQAMALLAWAWQRKERLQMKNEDILAGAPSAWQAPARVLMLAWDEAVRASSAVENWHSVLRPHLAVHRTLSPGTAALLAVHHNHKVALRGLHKGKSPLHRAGITDAPTDWLLALEYPPDAKQPHEKPLPVNTDQHLLDMAVGQ